MLLYIYTFDLLSFRVDLFALRMLPLLLLHRLLVLSFNATTQHN